MFTLMIVDDERIERNYLKSIIDKYSSKYLLVGEASNGKQAIEIALQKRPNVIIMDINIPLVNGLEASKEIKSKYDNITILNSAYSEFEFAQKAVNYGLDAYLLKPASEKEIIGTIESALHKKKLSGVIKSNAIDMDKALDSEYPYLIVDQLIDSILTKDFELLKLNINSFIDYISIQKGRLEEFRLYIINTIFSILRTVKKTVPEDVISLFKCESYIVKISRSQYWYDILFYTEEFFKSFIIIFKNIVSSADFTDLIQNYIDEKFNDDITLEQLSDIFHFSPSYLSRKFHQHKGYTINDYLTKVRINHSIYLLQNSNIPIREVSLQSGFKCISHFNRVFKATTGRTPSEFKKKGEKIV